MFFSLSVLACLMILWVECSTLLKDNVLRALEHSPRFGFMYGLVLHRTYYLTLFITILGLTTPSRFYTESGNKNFLTCAYFFLASFLCILYFIYFVLHLSLWLKVKKVLKVSCIIIQIILCYVKI